MTEKTIKVYYPLPWFPPVSLSTTCDLGCQHCQGHYLQPMDPVLSPHHLWIYGKRHAERGGTGLLVSGGFTRTGTLMNLPAMLPTLAKIKKHTNLLLALHTGFVDKQMAQSLKHQGIDVAFTHCIGDTTTIQEIMGLSATPQEYRDTLHNLQEAGVAVSPHICTGLHHGHLKGEHAAIQMIKDSCTPAAVVITTLCPTRGTPLENTPGPPPGDIQAIIQETRQYHPTVEIALGCMRPREKNLEEMALHAGVTRFANPSKRFLTYATTQGYTIQVYGACCGLPHSLEPQAVLGDGKHTVFRTPLAAP